MQDLTIDTCETTNPTAYHKSISIHDITRLIEVQGLTISETARRLNCNESNIRDHLKRNDITPGYLKNYKEYRADVLADFQYRILKSICAEDLKKASFSQKIMGYGILYDKERLERGQSTENITYADMVKVNEQIESKLELMRKKLGIEAQENVQESAGNDAE